MHMKLSYSLSAHVLHSDTERGDSDDSDSSVMNAGVRISALF